MAGPSPLPGSTARCSSPPCCRGPSHSTGRQQIAAATEELVIATRETGRDRRASRRMRVGDHLPREWRLCAMLPAMVIWRVVFPHAPICGIQIAPKDCGIFCGISCGISCGIFCGIFCGISCGIAGSPSIEIGHLPTPFGNDRLIRALGNTVMIGMLSLVFGFPVPIFRAPMFNEVLHRALGTTAPNLPNCRT